MNTLQIKGNWHVLKGKLKQRFANLTDDDLRWEEGLEEELFGRILRRTGQSRVQLEHFLDKRCNC